MATYINVPSNNRLKRKDVSATQNEGLAHLIQEKKKMDSATESTVENQSFLSKMRKGNMNKLQQQN